jgi:hypothetical protein
VGRSLVASPRRQAEEAGEEELGTGEIGRELVGAIGVGAGTVFGAGVGLRLQPHGIMDLMTEPADSHSGRATDGSGSTCVSRRTICPPRSIAVHGDLVSETIRALEASSAQNVVTRNRRGRAGCRCCRTPSECASSKALINCASRIPTGVGARMLAFPSIPRTIRSRNHSIRSQPPGSSGAM